MCSWRHRLAIPNKCSGADDYWSQACSGLLGRKSASWRQHTSTTPRTLGLNPGLSAESERSRFFDREAERDALQSYLQTEPTTILVLLGPRSSGKTALLQELFSSSAFDSGLPPSYLDARSRQLTEPSVLVSLLQEHGATALKISTDSGMGKMIPALAAQEKVGADTFSISGEKVMAAFLRRDIDNQSMNDVIAVYDDMLKLYKFIKPPKSSWPIICIDEANVLTQWQYGSLKKRETLSALLRFFCEEIDVVFFCPEVIGDFPKEEACHFFTGHALPRAGQEVELSEDDWAKVWEVYGGNVGQLVRAASAHAGDWDVALHRVWNPLLMRVQTGMDGGEGWSSHQYNLMVQSILSSAHHAVPVSDAKASIGKPALKALAQANLISYRPLSYWARDLPASAHGPNGEAVVTAPTPGHLYCMARLEKSRNWSLKPALRRQRSRMQEH